MRACVCVCMRMCLDAQYTHTYIYILTGDIECHAKGGEVVEAEGDVVGVGKRQAPLVTGLQHW